MKRERIYSLVESPRLIPMVKYVKVQRNLLSFWTNNLQHGNPMLGSKDQLIPL